MADEIKVGHIVNTPLGVAKVVGAGRGVVTVFFDDYPFGEKLFAIESVTLHDQIQDKGAIPGELAYIKKGVPYIEQEDDILPQPAPATSHQENDVHPFDKQQVAIWEAETGYKLDEPKGSQRFVEWVNTKWASRQKSKPLQFAITYFDPTDPEGERHEEWIYNDLDDAINKQSDLAMFWRTPAKDIHIYIKEPEEVVEILDKSNRKAPQEWKGKLIRYLEEFGTQDITLNEMDIDNAIDFFKSSIDAAQFTQSNLMIDYLKHLKKDLVVLDKTLKHREPIKIGDYEIIISETMTTRGFEQGVTVLKNEILVPMNEVPPHIKEEIAKLTKSETKIKLPEVKFQKIPMPKKIPPPKMYSIFSTIYKKLLKVVPLDIIRSKARAGRSEVPAFMDLGYDYLREDENGNPIIALHHYYKHPSGDMIADPDMEIRVLLDQEMAEAMTFQDLYGYRVVYPEPGKIDLKAKKDLNQFLNIWLRNLEKQGHKISVRN